MAKRGPYFQNPYGSHTGDDLAITVAAPIMSPDGQVLAVLAGHLRPDELQAIVGRRTGQYETADAFLVNSASLFATQPRLIADPVVLRQSISYRGQRALPGGE